jgi:hypothetical protein
MIFEKLDFILFSQVWESIPKTLISDILFFLFWNGYERKKRYNLMFEMDLLASWPKISVPNFNGISYISMNSSMIPIAATAAVWRQHR